jgi:Ser/Thr protein kinase RdoA (MazF antagonist)
MSTYFPATYSTLSTQALLTELLPDYDIDTPVECEFLHRGLNDTYLIKTSRQAKYILRVYRLGWRSLSEILYELAVLTHLNQQNIPVSIPLARKDGNFIRTLAAPEGERYTVLFTCAPGKNFSYEETEEAFFYGQAAARIHNAMDTFTSEHQRFALDLDHLIDLPLQAIAPRLVHRPEDWDYLQTLGCLLRQRIAAFPPDALEQGFCHGDFHGWNAKITEDKIITFFDFDCCGVGWRAYELAVFRWSARLGEKENDHWEPFLQGYQTERALNEIDLQAVPLFIGIRHIWLLGLHTGNGHHWGYDWMNDRYFDRAMKFFRQWETEYFSEAS